MPNYLYEKNGKKKKVSINLTDDFVAKGGEKSIYEKMGDAICIYHDSKQAIPERKIAELSVLKHPNIVVPYSPLYDTKNKHCGEVMPFLVDCHVLVQLFTNSFRRNHNITNKNIVDITKSIIEITKYCHSKNILLVDPNETNWLIDKSHQVWLIDTSCMQTQSYPGTAIKPAILDYSYNGFNENTDWFSIAVVLSWLWVGIHPYLAYLKKYDGRHAADMLETRMKKHESFFRSGTEFNRACRPLDEIPTALRNWFEIILDKGQRTPAPDDFTASIIIQRPTILPTHGNVTFTKMGQYIPKNGNEIIINLPFNRKLTSTLKDGIATVSTDGEFVASFMVDNQFESNNNIYYLSGGISRLITREANNKIRCSINHVGNAARLKTTKIYSGCVIQNLLGKYLLSIFLEPDKCTQIQLPELENYQILSAKYENHVFVVSGEKSGQYKTLIYRISSNGKYDVRILCDGPYEVNFCTNENGICVLATPTGDLEAFKNKIGSQGVKQVPGVLAGFQLYSTGPAIMCHDFTNTYRIALS